MSDKEIQRLAVLQDVRDRRITQVRAAEILNLSTRQITRLTESYQLSFFVMETAKIQIRH